MLNHKRKKSTLSVMKPRNKENKQMGNDTKHLPNKKSGSTSESHNCSRVSLKWPFI